MKKYIIGAILFLVVAIVSFSVIPMLNQSSNDENEDEETTEINNTAPEENYSEESMSPFQHEEALKFVEESFRNVFNYNEENYIERFDEFENEATPEVVGQLQGSAAGNLPDLEFRNEVRDIRVYASLDGESSEGVKDVLIQIDSAYYMNSQEPNERTELMSVDVQITEEGNYQVTRLESFGRIEAVSQP